MDDIPLSDMLDSTSSTPPKTQAATPFTETEAGDYTSLGTSMDGLDHSNSSQDLAIIGMACRVPGGVNSPSELWDFMMRKGDASGDMPSDRWEPYRRRNPKYASILERTTAKGYFLDNIEDFDASFFSISPLEAEQMDPQQRIALEVAWEALENAGIAPRRLAGSNTSVFMGVNSDDYGKLILDDLPNVSAHIGVGTAYCGIPSRISYVLDLLGPCVALDAACASSLVAVHNARQALLAGETDLAIAGGVNALLGPGLTRVLDEAGAIAPDGTCRSFDDLAHGYGRGEGAGVVILKRLNQAIADGDHVLAVLKGSAVCSDGKTVGIMAPNPYAQQLVARRALSAAGIAPNTVQYIEAHATSTSLGDPTEAGALAEVYGAESGRDQSTVCYIGSVKPNIGHLEAGAGVMGLIKAVMVLQNNLVPPQANLQTLNRKIDWKRALLHPCMEPTPLPHSSAPARAAIASYGYSGTVSHAIIEASPFTQNNITSRISTNPVLLLLSAPQSNRLPATAATLRKWLDEKHTEPDFSLEEVATTLASHRNHHRFRLAIAATSVSEAITALDQVALDVKNRYVIQNRANPSETTKDPVWVFSGHGAQWPNMGKELYQTSLRFQEVVRQLEPIIQEELGFSAIETLLTGQGLDQSDVIQAMTFLIHLGLSAILVEEAGPPSAIVGHSLGEAAAAVVAGAITWKEGALLVCRRARLYREVMGDGAMLWVRLSAEDARVRLEGSEVDVAIDASPSSCVLSGSPTSIRQVANLWKQQGIEASPVASDIAFHSRLLTPLADPLRDALQNALHPQKPTIPLYSTSHLDPRTDILHNGDYWVNNMIAPVRLRSAIAATVADGFCTFVEVSSHPIVAHSVQETVRQETAEAALISPTLFRNQPAMKSILATAGRLHCFGISVPRTEPKSSAPWRSDIPGTVWNHQAFYRKIDHASSSFTAAVTHDPANNDLLGARTVIWGSDQILFQTQLTEENRPFPGRHPLHGSEIVPAAVLINTLLKASVPHSLHTVSLKVPVIVSPARDVQILRAPSEARITSRLRTAEAAKTDDDASWLVNTTTELERQTTPLTVSRLNLTQLQERLRETLQATFSTDYLESMGVSDMGFPWKVLEHIANGDEEFLAQVDTDPEGTGTGMNNSWVSFIDAATSIASTLFYRKRKLRMPTAVARVIAPDFPTVSSPKIGYIYCKRAGETASDVLLCAEDGTVLMEFQKMAFAGIEGEAFSRQSATGLVHQVSWLPTILAEQPLSFQQVAFLIPGCDASMTNPNPLLEGYLQQLKVQGIPSSVHCTADDLPLTDSPTLIVYLPRVPDSMANMMSEIENSCGLLVKTCEHLVAHSLSSHKICTIVHPHGVLPKLGFAPLYGLSRIIQSEHPEIWGSLIEVEDERFPWMAVKYVQGADIIKMSDSVPRTARLRPFAALETPSSKAPQFSPGSTYLITGGLGALGQKVAEWMVKQGARRLVLISRRSLPPRSSWNSSTDSVLARITALENQGASIYPLSVDISHPDGAAHLSHSLDQLPIPAVKGVVHAAGTLEDQLFEQITPQAFHNVLAPKIQGALNLNTLFPVGKLDFFILFSSCGQLFGFPGQASYASGNAFLDALATQRRTQGDSTTAIQWTSWRGLGMAASTEYINAELTARGITDISVEEAFLAWEQLAARHTDHGVVLRTRHLEFDEPLPHPILRDIVTRAAAPTSASYPDGQKPTTATTPRSEADLSAAITACVARTLSMNELDIDPLIALSELGMDSVMSITFRTQLQQVLKLPVGPTLIWKCPTVQHLVKHFVQEAGSA